LCRPTALRLFAARGILFHPKGVFSLCRPTQLRFIAARGDLFASDSDREN